MTLRDKIAAVLDSIGRNDVAAEIIEGLLRAEVATDLEEAAAKLERVRASWRESKARRRRVGDLTAPLRMRILEKFGFRCTCCGATAATATLHVDHIKPVSAGGETVEENLTVLCEACNLGKGAAVQGMSTDTSTEASRETGGISSPPSGSSLSLEISKPPDQTRVEETLVTKRNAVYAHYRTYHARSFPSPRADSKESKLIEKRFAEGYSVEDLKTAIDGYHRSPWHCGDNDRGTKYLDLALFVRDGTHVAKGIELASAPRAGPALSPAAAKEQRTTDAIGEWLRRKQEASNDAGTGQSALRLGVQGGSHNVSG